MRNNEHCFHATPFDNECKHPSVDQIAEAALQRASGRNEALSAISKQVFELMATSSITSNLDALLERTFTILRGSPELPLDSRGAIVLANPRRYYFQVAQYGMDSTSKTDFRWHPHFFEHAALLRGSLIRSSMLDDTALGGSRKSLLLLPLLVENKFIGYAVLFAEISY